MNVAFAGFRHNHIFSLYRAAGEESGITVTGCFEENEQARHEAEQLLGAKFTYSTYDEILKDDTVDIVAIGDYYGKRGKLIIEALNSGKHVICDKPMCTELYELDEIQRLSREKKLQVCCMLDLRYMPQTERARQIIESGEIGQVHIVSFTGQHCLSYGSRPGWYFEKGKHGGTINDIAIHGIDLVRYITGKNLTGIDCAKTWNAFADREPDFKDCGQFVLDMEGVSVMADVSYAAPAFQGIMPTYWNFKFWGTKGMLSFGYEDNKIHLYKGTEQVIDCGSSTPHFFADMLSQIQGRETVLNRVDMLQSQKQVLLIQKFAEKED